MSEEFPVNLESGRFMRTWLYSQLFRPPPYPTRSFTDQTVIVTGANKGLGLEASRHFYRLDCAKLILAVRTITKGETAKEDIVRSVTHRTDTNAIDVWPLDLSSTESTLTFAERVKKELPRVDALVENAGMISQTYSASEGFEQTIQVNVLNMFLLALSLLPKLRDTRTAFANSLTHLVIVSSEAHRLTKFTQLNAPDIYQKMNEENGFDGLESYWISKLIEVLFTRELVSRLHASQSPTPPVTIDIVNPGLCKTDNLNGAKLAFFIISRFLGRRPEIGARALVHGAAAGEGSHGEFMSDGENQDVEKWIYGDVGQRAQKKVFEQTMKVLERRKPGLGATVGV